MGTRHSRNDSSTEQSTRNDSSTEESTRNDSSTEESTEPLNHFEAIEYCERTGIHVLAVAIDIGNTCTKHGFLWIQYKSDLSHLGVFPHVYDDQSFVSEVCPTVVLLDGNEQFNSLGSEAIDKYEGNKEWHLFRQIKQPLYLLSDEADVYLCDELGRKTRATTVIGAIINHHRDHIFTILQERIAVLTREDIFVVITVPAVFSVHAINVVKEAALKAGISDSKFRIVPEPVSALEYCQSMHIHRQGRCTYYHKGVLASPAEDFLADWKQYVVVDIGGETVDVTIIEKDSDGNLIELDKVCGFGYGSNKVHDAFDNLLTVCFGPEVYTTFRNDKEFHDEYRCLHRSFDQKMENVDLDSVNNVHFDISAIYNLGNKCARNCDDVLKMSLYAGTIKRKGGVITIPMVVLRDFLSVFCSNILKFTTDECKDKMVCNTCILLVGGYADTKMVQKAFACQFVDVDIFIPTNPAFATAGGAAILGFKSHPNVRRTEVTSKAIKSFGDDVTNTSDSLPSSMESGSDFVKSIKDMSLTSDDTDVATVSSKLIKAIKSFGDGVTNTGDSLPSCMESGSDFVKSIKDMSLTSDDTDVATVPSKLLKGIISMKERMKGNPQVITVSRGDITADVIEAYRSIDVARPLLVKFTGDGDRDATEEMFGFFWENISSEWFKGENAAVPLVPIEKKTEARRVFPVLGKIIEHMLCILGHFPPQLCRSLLLNMGNPEGDVDSELILEDYMLFLPEMERELLIQSMGESAWSPKRKTRLEIFFNVNNIARNPTPQSFKDDILNIAYEQIIDSSHVYIGLMRCGMSDFAKEHVLNTLEAASVILEYKERAATGEALAKMVEAIFDGSEYGREERVILNYLMNFVNNLSKRQVRRLILWLTGSPNMPKKIEVIFSTSRRGVSKCVARRDNGVLELSRHFTSYQDFERQLMSEVDKAFFTATD